MKSGSIFKLDLKTLALLEVAKLITPRSSHSLVASPFGIGIVGGYSNGQTVISQCELFDFKSVQPLGNLIYPVASPGICSFGD